MATKSEYQHTKKHFKSEKKKDVLKKDFDKKEKLARHHASPKQERDVKMSIKKIEQEEGRQSRRLEKHLGLK